MALARASDRDGRSEAAVPPLTPRTLPEGYGLRELDDGDLESAVHLWEEASAGAVKSVFSLAETLSAVRSGHPALVAVAAGEVIGAIAARIEGDRAWLVRWVVSPPHRGLGVGTSLLRGLERRLTAAGVRSLSVLLPTRSVDSALFNAAGFQSRTDVVYLERRRLRASPVDDRLAELGAEWPPPTMWDSIGGMEAEKDLVERRIILPLAHPGLAQSHGVSPPVAVILFGPPGTGKTTFARAVAARLGWPFVELLPSQLGSDPHERAASLRDLFTRLCLLDEVVVLIDEVDEIASRRVAGHWGAPLTNELLKAIPAFRDSGSKLLVCATNHVGELDPAIVRPGRFDYLLPVGPPDLVARTAIWDHYVARHRSPSVDTTILAAASELFSPADIEFAARKAAQASFERSLETGVDTPASVDAYRSAIANTRPSLSPEMLAAFQDEIASFARF